MGDLDTSLITEFSLRPAFYDKTSANYKDKTYVERAWSEIAFKLGYNVALLKDRMYQLRNRYNLEKRKVDAMRQDGIPSPHSTWPLFQHLNFLDGHIRPRKSYKSMMRRSNAKEEDMDDDMYNEIPMPPMVEIKYEPHCDNELSSLFEQSSYVSEDDAGNSTQNGDHFVNPANFLDDTESEHDPNSDGVQQQQQLQQHQQQQIQQQQHQQQQQQQQQLLQQQQHQQLLTPLRNSTNSSGTQANNISLRNIQSLKRARSDFRLSSPHAHPLQRPMKVAKVHQIGDKFEAFGSFMSSSLMDLPEKKALELVEKFTNELVHALIDKS